MVVVTTVHSHNFQWNTSSPTDPILKPRPVEFEIKELADYTPVYIDLRGVNFQDIKEIGLKLDDVFKGAVVVQDSLEQICVYLEEGESLDSGIVELVFSYHTKSQPYERKTLRIAGENLVKSNIAGDEKYQVFNIKLSQEELDNPTPPVFTLHPNYPNPFNPTTTIRYSIERPGQASIEIYNVKGQLVKALLSGFLD